VDPLLPALLPPGEADRQDWLYFQERLADPSLAARGLAVRFDWYTHLAVPVGGRRLGGYLSAADIMTGLAIRALLLGHPGFPDVRLRWSPDPDCCHVVEWGARAPLSDDDEVRGRFYGYSDHAIAQCKELLAARP
jgi:hypothetical protein